jgi:hypothetical protein
MQPAAQPGTKPEGSAKEARHPLVTEVLYAVPKDADPDQDGRRSATGDEFIELVNPTDKPINLKGYKIADAKKGVPPDAKGKDKPGDKDNRFSFTFPELSLQPGEVVVVFNGYESSPAAPCGTQDAAGKKNPKFHDAYVFSAQVKSQYVAFANTADCIALYDPDGNTIECIHWGEKQKPEAAPKTSKLPEARGSVQRTSVTGEFVRHTDLTGDDANEVCSPGRFRLKKDSQDPPRGAPPSSSSPASTPTPRK